MSRWTVFIIACATTLLAVACVEPEVDSDYSEIVNPTPPPLPPPQPPTPSPPTPMPPHHQDPSPPDEPIPLPSVCNQCHQPYPYPYPRPGAPRPLPPNNPCTSCHIMPAPMPDPRDPHPNGPPPGIPRPLPPGNGPPYCSNCHPILLPPLPDVLSTDVLTTFAAEDQPGG